MFCPDWGCLGVHETCAIVCRSLSALGDVIAAHKTGSSHVPYRNSKLTFLLKDSLGGDAKVSQCTAVYLSAVVVCGLWPMCQFLRLVHFELHGFGFTVVCPLKVFSWLIAIAPARLLSRLLVCCWIAGQVLMFVNVSGDSDNLNETFCSLTFAARCRAVSLGQAKRHVSSIKSPLSVGSGGALSARSAVKRTGSEASMMSDSSSRLGDFDDAHGSDDGDSPMFAQFASASALHAGSKPSVVTAVKKGGRPPLGSGSARF